MGHIQVSTLPRCLASKVPRSSTLMYIMQIQVNVLLYLLCYFWELQLFQIGSPAQKPADALSLTSFDLRKITGDMERR